MNYPRHLTFSLPPTYQHHLSGIWLSTAASLQTARGCWSGEPATCGPWVLTVSPCGNIPVGHLSLPRFSPQSGLPVFPFDPRLRRAKISDGVLQINRLRKTKQLHSSENRCGCLLVTFPSHHPLLFFSTVIIYFFIFYFHYYYCSDYCILVSYVV